MLTWNVPTSGKCTYLAKSATLLCCLSPILVEILPIMQISSDILVSKIFWAHCSQVPRRFYSCLTIDNIKPELCPNSAPLYNPMSVVDNSAPLFLHSSHFNCNNDKFNLLSRVLKENINKIYKMQHFTTLGNAAYKFFKTFRVSAVTGGVEYFREDRQHTISLGTRLCKCAVYLRENIHPPPPPPPCHGRHSLPTRD